MRRITVAALAGIMFCLVASGVWLFNHKNNFIWQKQLVTNKYGPVSVASPLLTSDQQVLVFVDTKKYPPENLAERIAHTGAKAVIVDTESAFKTFSADHPLCLDAKQVAASIHSLVKEISLTEDKPLIVSGIEDGALLPFLQAQSTSENNITDVSIEFSVELPASVTVCPPILTNDHDTPHTLTSSPPMAGTWYSAWSDHPPQDTALFIRNLPQTKIWIAPYDTPADTVLIEELKRLIDPTTSLSAPMAVVEVPVEGGHDTVTLFFSGDGGWRDLDRIVAGEMARQGYPVVGIDTLRTFWSRKTPELATDELARTLTYYRKAWGAKSFVLAGYSFGADILPSIYNRLTPADQESICLVVLLALSRQADFEIEVSGWLGQNSGESPLAPELARLPQNKIICVYGKEEKTETACTDIANSQAYLLELPGGHHFDEDYPKLTRLILERYQKAGIQGGQAAPR